PGLEVDVGHDRHRRTTHDAGEPPRRRVVVARATNDVGAGLGQRIDLRERRVDVPGRRRRHRLHRHGRVAADRDLTDVDLTGGATGRHAGLLNGRASTPSRRRARSSGGGGKYSDSSVTVSSSTPSTGARTATTASTVSSGALAPAHTPTTSTSASAARSSSRASSMCWTLAQPAARATATRAWVLDEFSLPITTTASTCGASARTAC